VKRILLVILCIVFYLLITKITTLLNIFLPYTNLVLTILFTIVVFAYDASCDKIVLGSYFLFTLVFLFFRTKVNDNLNFEFYLWKWLKIIFKNPIVFINIFGNIFLFVPYVFFIKSKYYWLIIIILIFGLEFMQYVTHRGVMDIVDVTLNLFGVALTIPFKWRYYGQQRKATK